MPILTEQERCGTVLADKYAIESILGRGGMGVVFRARHLHTDRPVAIKILRPDLSHDITLGKRFVREAKAASLLRHPNVVEVLDLGIEDGGTVYQVLELLEGEPLSRVLEFKGSLGPTQTLEVLLPVMDALVAAHERGIVHRDLKPDNLFLARSRDGRLTPTLLDFGIAKMMDGKQSLATRTGSVMGTPHYMAPEQARGSKAHGPAIDIWAMGVIAFECLTGAVPFDAESPTMVLLKILTEPAPRLDALDPGIAASIADVIDAALQPDPEARHGSMSDFVDALRAAAEEAAIDVPAPRESTAGPLTFPPPDQEADPTGVTELPDDDVLALEGIRRDSDHATLAARSRAVGHAPGAGGTLLGHGDAHSPDAREDGAASAPVGEEPLPGSDAERDGVAANGAPTPVAPEVGPAGGRGRVALLGVAALAAASVIGAIAWSSLGVAPREDATTVTASGAEPRGEETEPAIPDVGALAEPAAPEPEVAAATGEEPEPLETETAEDAPVTVEEPRPAPRTVRAARRETHTESRRPPRAGSTPPARRRPASEQDEPTGDGRLPGVVEW